MQKQVLCDIIKENLFPSLLLWHGPIFIFLILSGEECKQDHRCHEDHRDRPCRRELRSEVLRSQLIDCKEDREENPVINMGEPVEFTDKNFSDLNVFVVHKTLSKK